MNYPNYPPLHILTRLIQRRFLLLLVCWSIGCFSLSSCTISHAGLLANWNFDDGTLADSSGNGLNLTKTPQESSTDINSGSFSYIDNGNGKALSADGMSSAYVDFGNKATLDSFTISMWVDANPVHWDNYWTIYGSSLDTSVDPLEIPWNDGNSGIRFQSRGNSTTNVAIYVDSIANFSGGNYTITDNGGYNHILFTSANGKGTFYFNGKAAESTLNITSTQMMGLFSLAGSVFQSSGDDRNMRGIFDNVSVYNRGLSATEVTSIYNAESSSTNNFADIYSRELSETGGMWSESVWKHQLGESGAVTANQAWTDYSQVKLSSSSNEATLTIDQNIHTSKTTLENVGITFSVAEEKTAVMRGLNGYGFTKSGAGTLKIEGNEHYSTITSRISLVVEEGILDITNDAKLFSKYTESVVTVKTGGTLRVDNLVTYHTSNLGTLSSNNNVRVLDGGTIEIIGGTQHGNNSFTVNSTGGTLLSTDAKSTVTFYKHTDSSNVDYPIRLNGTLTVGGAGNFVFNAPFANEGGLTKIGTGNVTIASSENTFTGRLDAREGILAISGKTQSNIHVRGGEVQVISGANVSAGTIRISDMDHLSGKTSALNIQGGTVTITGTNKTDTTSANLMIGHWAGDAVLNITGGTLNVKDAWTIVSWDSSGKLDISGTGVANLYGINIHNLRNRDASLNVTEGGTLNVGAAGIFFVPTAEVPVQKENKTITFGNATIGAFADWSSSMNIALSGTAAGTTFLTTDSVDSTSGRTITLSGLLSGTGGLNVAGNGALVLSGNNTYSGDTTVSSGATLQLDGSLANSTLTLMENATLGGNGEAHLQGLETMADSRLLFEIDTEGNRFSLNIDDIAILEAGVLDFDIEDIHAVTDTPWHLLSAPQLELPEHLSELLAEAWRGIVDLNLFYADDQGFSLVASISSANVPEPSTWMLGIFGILGGMWWIRKNEALRKAC